MGGVGVAAQGDGHREVRHEVGQCAQLSGKDEVKQRPQFLQVVLHRRARQDEAVTRPELHDKTRQELHDKKQTFGTTQIRNYMTKTQTFDKLQTLHL